MVRHELTARPFEQLELIQKRYPKQDHYTAIDPAFEDGLAALFPPAKIR